ncbi:GNAT family N-acetyltransferase [Bacillus sp. S/N-304-OC-R1]|uniref:GNAT family N-acetyltransferase n=1 Tax=Bacillus sp. S/N-304-OC-R1 TaxID=2758034 RepID=UPI001C8D5547|nr:GNAT family N-acetyltransferase [Bacillus sp. S/N-304-OC-R1]MBY0121662.1 GNAT family N-acetyltransferase [Bacillus sp. S/N-304-OC-R1]
MEITIQCLRDEDALELFEFELENREYFEKMVPSRGDDYYNYDTFKIKHKSLLDEQAEGLSYFYLIKNKNGSILGRMNLVDIDKSQMLGHLGYRVGKENVGKGIASSALKLLLENITVNEGIKKILAKTTTINTASQKVLVKNGFKQIETNEDDEAFYLNGESLTFQYYSWNKSS